MLGPWAGATKIRAAVTSTDPATNQALLEQDVHGGVHWGIAGGSSKGADNGIAREVASALKKQVP